MLLFAIWPFTRLVHAFTAPLHYLFRPYIVYRSRDARAAPDVAARPAGCRSAPATATAVTLQRGGTVTSSGRRARRRPARARPRNLVARHAGLRDQLLGVEPDRARSGVRYTAGARARPATEKSLLVAIPVLVGARRPDPVGALTDRFGGRLMFPMLMLRRPSPFVLLVAVAGNHESYALLLVFGFFLGIAGTTFAVGVPFVNAWYEPARRGFATGVFGAGMGGTALSAFFTPRFVTWFGYTVTHVIIAVALVAIGGHLLVRACATRRCGSRTPTRSSRSSSRRCKLPVTWQMSFLYAVTFGGFVAFSTYLPTYLKDVYDFDLTDAGHPHRRLRHRRRRRPTDRRHALRPGRPADRRRDLAGRHRGARGRRRRSSPPLELPAGADLRRAWRSSSGSAPAACSPGWPARAAGAGRQRRPASSARPVAWAASSRRWSWARRTRRSSPATVSGLSLLVLVAAGALVFTLTGMRGESTTSVGSRRSPPRTG